MNGKTDLILVSTVNSFLWDNGLKPVSINEELHKDIPEVNLHTIGNKNFWNHFWRRLVYTPLSFPQSPNTPISTILEEDMSRLATDSIRSILSKKFELLTSSEELTSALENVSKIFHEDFPYDFILEYKGERLGLMVLDKCYTSVGEEILIYKLNHHITNFRGLF